MTASLALAESEAQAQTALSESEFRALYEATARPLKSYLARTTGDGALADDLLQESYLRYLRAGEPGWMPPSRGTTCSG